MRLILFCLCLCTLFIISCAQQPTEQSACELDSDCIPLPGCHPMECIYAEDAGIYQQPTICTEEFRFNAAYKPEDCECIDKDCINSNMYDTAQKQYITLDKEKCAVLLYQCVEPKQPFVDEKGCGCVQPEKEYCTTARPDLCTLEYAAVCGWFGPEVRCITYPCAQDYGNACLACADEKVAYWTEGECPALDCPDPQTDYQTALTYLEEAEQVVQTHSLCVNMLLKNGTMIHTMEPIIDDIFRQVDRCEECDIIIATE